MTRREVTTAKSSDDGPASHVFVTLKQCGVDANTPGRRLPIWFATKSSSLATIGLAAVASAVRYLPAQHIAVATPTSKRFAAARLDIPLSEVAIRRPRRSCDKVFATRARLLVQPI
jgi:hypothetical protein